MQLKTTTAIPVIKFHYFAETLSNYLDHLQGEILSFCVKRERKKERQTDRQTGCAPIEIERERVRGLGTNR
jgi:hypothetical protein